MGLTGRRFGSRPPLPLYMLGALPPSRPLVTLAGVVEARFQEKTRPQTRRTRQPSPPSTPSQRLPTAHRPTPPPPPQPPPPPTQPSRTVQGDLVPTTRARESMPLVPLALVKIAKDDTQHPFAFSSRAGPATSFNTPTFQPPPIDDIAVIVSPKDTFTSSPNPASISCPSLCRLGTLDTCPHPSLTTAICQHTSSSPLLQNSHLTIPPSPLHPILFETVPLSLYSPYHPTLALLPCSRLANTSHPNLQNPASTFPTHHAFLPCLPQGSPLLKRHLARLDLFSPLFLLDPILRLHPRLYS
ncbi:hypothetical protein AMTRI_Chr07g76070 [Amborella trichopoda]